MSIDFSSLKKNRQSVFNNLTQEMNKLNAQPQSEDTRFWKPEVDKSGNGYAIIRFLPAPAGEDVPFVRVWDHGFQGPGGWYIEKSLTTVGQKDPVSEYNAELWNSGIEANKEVVRKQKRRLTYYSNIYVVKDPSHPENEGKVFIFKYGKKIFEKLNAAMNPEFEDEAPMNPFDLWEGANFKLKIRNVEGYRNYDKSEFADKSALLEGDDEKLENLWKQEFSLKEFTEKKHFKSYEQLKGRLDKVLGFEGVAPATKAESAVVNKFNDDDIATIDKKIVEHDEDLDYFKSLAEQE